MSQSEPKPALFDPEREPHVDPRDAVAVVHRFLRRCRAWGAEREVPARLERLAAAPTLAEAAKLHEWVAWVAFVDHALAEVERGALDPWFLDGDEL